MGKQQKTLREAINCPFRSWCRGRFPARKETRSDLPRIEAPEPLRRWDCLWALNFRMTLYLSIRKDLERADGQPLLCLAWLRAIFEYEMVAAEFKLPNNSTKEQDDELYMRSDL